MNQSPDEETSHELAAIAARVIGAIVIAALCYAAVQVLYWIGLITQIGAK